MTAPAATVSAEWGFADRHIGPSADEVARMLVALGVETIDQLIAEGEISDGWLANHGLISASAS